MRKALPPLLVAAYGAGVAYLMLTIHPLTGAVLLLVPIGIGLWAMTRARAMAPTDPVGSLRWFERAQLLPYALAAGASAVLMWLAVLFAPPDKPTPAPDAPDSPPPTTFEKYFPEILKALSGAVSVFITAAFIKSSEEPDSWVADQVKAEFQKAFRFRADSDGENAVRATTYMGAGWGKDGREKRAAAIATAIKDPDQKA